MSLGKSLPEGLAAAIFRLRFTKSAAEKITERPVEVEYKCKYRNPVIQLSTAIVMRTLSKRRQTPITDEGICSNALLKLP
jgi:hypothetical protein